MSFPIDTTIPNEPNDPIDDVPLMRGNFNNINSYLKVDHIEAGAPGNGYHSKVTYYDVAAPGVPVGNTSVGYTVLGSAAPAVPEGRFRNSLGVFPTSAIRACVLFMGDNSAVGTVITQLNSFNVDEVKKVGSGVYKVTMTSGATTGTDFMVFMQASAGGGGTYTKAANEISTIPVSVNSLLSLVVLQI